MSFAITRVSGYSLVAAKDPGPVHPWLGPALRGMVKEALKRQVCSHPDFRPTATDLPECRQCHLKNECVHTATMESLPEEGGREKMPAMILVPEFQPAAVDHPLKDPGLPFSLTFVGTCHQHLTTVITCIEEASRGRGLGGIRHRIPVKLIAPEQIKTNSTLISEQSLGNPIASDCGTIPRVRIDLTTPLRLIRRIRTGNRRKSDLVTEPSFTELAQVAVSVVSRFWTQFVGPLKISREQLRTQTESVQVAEHRLQSFSQPVSRSRSRVSTSWITGHIIYKDVPAAILPWLISGGWLHCGEMRSAGCGQWSVSLVD